jgi:hypothetical protein
MSFYDEKNEIIWQVARTNVKVKPENMYRCGTLSVVTNCIFIFIFLPTFFKKIAVRWFHLPLFENTYIYHPFLKFYLSVRFFLIPK